MNEPREIWHPRRLLLSLLDEADRRLVLAHTARLARALETEISSVFVEEADLFDLASLALGIEVGAVSQRLRQLDAATLLAESELRAAGFRRELMALAAGLGRTAEMEVLRGHPLDSLRQARRDDLVYYTGSFERLSRPLARDLLEETKGTAGLLLSPSRAGRANGPLVATIGSELMAERLLPTLRRLAGEKELQVQIVAEAGRELAAGTVLAERHRAGLLVSEAGEPAADTADAVRAALRRLRCPLLLINPSQG